jgi:hypothetical protein
MAAKPGFFNDNLFRAYPFLENQDAAARIPDRAIVDFGCTFLPGSTYDERVDRVYLAWVRRVNCGLGTTTTTSSGDEEVPIGDLEFAFRTSADGMENSLLVFQISGVAEQFATVDGWYFEVVDEDVPSSFDEPEIDCETLPKWEGFLTVGDLEDLVLALDCGEYVDGDYDVEPARVENRANHYVRSLRLANAERTRATTAAGCRPLCWSFDFKDYYFVCGCFSGDVLFGEGHSLTPTIDVGQNAIALTASPGSGLGYPCVEQPYFADEEAPAGRSTFSGSLLCSEVIRQINGIAAAQFVFQHGPGVSITAKPAQHRLIIDVNMLGFAAKPDVDPDEAVPCEPPDSDPCECGPADEADFECPDPPEEGGCSGSVGVYSKRTGGPQDTVLSFVAKDGEQFLTDAPIRTLRYYYEDRDTESGPYVELAVDLAVGWSAEQLQAALESIDEIGEGNVSVLKGTSVYQGRSIGWFTIRFIGDFAGTKVEFGIAWKDGYMTPSGECEEYLSAASVFSWAISGDDVGQWEADSRYIAADPCDREFLDETPSDHLRGYLQVGGLVNARHQIRIYGSPTADGTFFLSYDEGDTVDIACNAAASVVEEAIEDILGVGNVSVTGDPGNYLVEYTGDLGGQPIELPTATIDPCPEQPPMTSTTPEGSSAVFTSYAISGPPGSVTAIWKYTGGTTPCFSDPTCGYDLPTVSPLSNDTSAGSTYTRDANDLITGGDPADNNLTRWLDDATITSLILDYSPSHRAPIVTRSGGSEPTFRVDNTHSLYQQVWINDADDYQLVVELYSAEGVGAVDIKLAGLYRWRDASTFLAPGAARGTPVYQAAYGSEDVVPLTITIPFSAPLGSYQAGYGPTPTGMNLLLSILTTGLRVLEVASVRLERVV